MNKKIQEVREYLEEKATMQRNHLKGKYACHMELILYNYLLSQRQDGYTIKCTMALSDWYRVFGMCNNRYMDTENNEELLKLENQLKNMIPLDKKKLYDFYYQENNRMKTIVMNTLERLKNCRLADYSESYILDLSDGTKRVATSLEEGAIRNAEYDTLREMGFKYIYNIRQYGLQNKFYSSALEKINATSDSPVRIERYYQALTILCDTRVILGRLKEIGISPDDDSAFLCELELMNITVCDSFLQSVLTKIEKDPKMKDSLKYKQFLIRELIELKDDDIPDTCKEFFDNIKYTNSVMIGYDSNVL